MTKREEQYIQLVEVVRAGFEAHGAEDGCLCARCMANVAVAEIFRFVDDGVDNGG